MVDVITVLSFVAVTGLLFLLAEQIRRAHENPVKRRLEAAGVPSVLVAPKSDAGPLWGSFAEQIPQPTSTKSEIEFELRQAGYYHPSALNIYLGIRNGIVIAIVISTAVLAAIVGPERESIVVRVGIVGLAIAALSWGIPRLMLKAAAKRRVDRIARSLPYALDLITMCLSGGLSLRDSLEHVSDEVGHAHRDLSDELSIVLRQSEIGSMEAAFRHFAARMRHPEISALVALIIQNQQLGTNIAQSIRDFAEGARLKWRQLADEQAGRASVYMLFPIVFCLLPAVFILLWGPAALDLWDFFQNMDDRISDVPEVGTINRSGQ